MISPCGDIMTPKESDSSYENLIMKKNLELLKESENAKNNNLIEKDVKRVVRYVNKKEIFNYEPGMVKKKKSKQMCLNHALPKNL